MSSTTSPTTDESAYTVFKQDGSHQFYCRWTLEEDRMLSKAVADHGPHKWTLVSRYVPGRTAVQCSTRWFGALNPNVHKGRWSSHEDQALTKAVRYFQSITKATSLPWNRIAEHIPNRTGIQCQARWTEALDPAVRKGRWHPDEDKQLAEAIAQYGCCWIRVASLIPTRTQRQCRTRWNQIHSQQLKSSASTASGKGLVNRRSSSLSKNTISARPSAPIHYEFVPSLPIPHDPEDTPSPSYFHTTSPSSPAEIDDILAIYVSNNDDNMESSLSSRSSSYSSSSSTYSSPPTSALYLPVTTPPNKEQNRSLLQHDLFPMITTNETNNINNGCSSNNSNNNNFTSNCNNTSNSNNNNFLFTTSADFDFLLNYNNNNLSP